MKKRIILTLVSLSFLLSLMAAADKPRLIIFISVDQMRADYLERFQADFSGGLKLLTEEGTVFRNAFLNYMPSETGPGHAALSTGCYPWKTGILSNNWVDPSSRKEIYCVEDTTAEKVDAEGGGFSPKKLEVSSIGDWLKSASPESRVIGISIKDRAAILMGGHRANFAFWYDPKTGHMVTSEYYTHSEPSWVRSFNESNWIDHHVPDAWKTLRPSVFYEQFGPDTLKGEKPWNGSTAFPHYFKPGKKSEMLPRSPFGDNLVLDFARSAIQSEQLGQREAVDLLCISLSCTDYIGHAFGPNSWEMADQMLRLDASLGSFISDAEQIVGRGRILIVLSADHGVLPLPEYTVNVLHGDARRILAKRTINPAIAALDQTLQKELGTNEHIIQEDAFLNYSAAAKGGVDSLHLEHRVKEGLLKIDGFADVYFRRELLDPSTPERPYLDYYRRGYFPPRGEDMLMRFCEGCLVTSSATGTSHGSPYPYDQHVPIVFWGTGVHAETVNRTVHTVDIAPTLAKLLHVPCPPTVDGTPLPELNR